MTRTLDEIVWAVNPKHDTLENFILFLGSHTQDLADSAGLRSRFNMPDSIPERMMPSHVRHHLYLAAKEGHDVNIAEKSLVDLGMKIGRIARLVDQTETDAWVVSSASQEVLEWFVGHSLPTFAMFGRFRKLPLAATGLDKIPAFRAAVRRLANLGHRRIVLLQPKHNRKPTPALLVRESLDEMEAHGIKTGSYNTPDGEQSPAGLRRCLDSLFAVSPPTAIIFDRPSELIGAQIYLAHRRILAPRDVSLVCDDDPAFEWCEPSISCIRWHSRSWVRRVVQWVDNVSNGRNDLRQGLTKAKFVEKGSIGPPPSI